MKEEKKLERQAELDMRAERKKREEEEWQERKRKERWKGSRVKEDGNLQILNYIRCRLTGYVGRRRGTKKNRERKARRGRIQQDEGHVCRRGTTNFVCLVLDWPQRTIWRDETLKGRRILSRVSRGEKSKVGRVCRVRKGIVKCNYCDWFVSNRANSNGKWCL